MKIAVCAKLTPDTEDVKVSPEGAPNIGSATWNVSEYDKQAIQAAADLGAETVAISAGASAINQSRLIKSLMSQGNLESMIRIADDSLADADSHTIAKVLASAIKRSGTDYAFFGEGSSDIYARSMASQVAVELGWPSVTCVDNIEADGDILVLVRDVEDGMEIVEVKGPCCISVTSTINTPPLPNMKAILAAGKKPIEDLSLADLGVQVNPVLEVVSRGVPAQPGRQQIILEGSPEEVAAQLVAKLSADQVL